MIKTSIVLIMSTATQPIVLEREQQSPIAARGVSINVLLHGHDTGGLYSIIEYAAESGAPGPALHLHRKTFESFQVLEGDFQFVIGKERIAARAGTFVHVPPGMPHAFWNCSGKVAKMVITLSPAGLEDYLKDLLKLASEHADTGLDIRPLIASMGHKYDQDVLGPSPAMG